MNKTIKQLLLLSLTGVFTTLSAQALERDSDGIYLIGSTADYEEFCDLVNKGDTYASARVTADGIVVTRSIGVGDREYHFRGKFDGQGHTLTLNGVPLFENTQHGSVISNVNLTGSITTTGEYAGSLIAHAVSPTIENCNSDATINATGAIKAGGLVGNSRGTATLTGSSFTGQVTGAEENAGLIGWNQHTAIIRDCQAVGANTLAGNLVEGANIVENTLLGDREVAMAVETTDSVAASTAAKVAPMGTIGASFDGINYSLSESSRHAAVIDVSPSLLSVKVPPTVTLDGVEYIVTDVNSMNGGKNMERVEIPNTVNKIHNDAFRECTKLEDVIFADGTTTLDLGFNDYPFFDEQLFEFCPIYYVYIGRNLSWDKDEDEPFETRDKLKYIEFGPRVTVVGNSNGGSDGENQLFNGCYHVTAYYLFGDEESLGSEVTFYCSEGMSSATHAYIGRDIKASKYTEFTVLGSGWGISDELLEVKYGPYATYVTSKMFSGIAATPNNKLNVLYLEEATRLTTIKERAFADCDKLEKVDFSNTSLNTIEKEGFYDCDKLAKVDFGVTVEYIGQSAFDDCGLTSVILPGSVKCLGYKAFYDCDEMTSLSIMPGEGELLCNWEVDGDLEARTFDSCGNLKKLYLNRTLTYNEIGENASPFYDSYFEDIVIDNNVTQLGEYMFKHSNKLKSLFIGTGISWIPNTCFEKSTEVTNLHIADSESPIMLGNSIRDFMVSTLYLGRSVTDVSQLPKWQGTLEVVEFGDNVNVVKTNSFDVYNNIKLLKLPAGITVEKNGFVGCGIESIYIKGDATFKSYAFYGVNNIQEMTVLGKLTVERHAIYPSVDDLKPIKSLNVFFKEDPKDESDPEAFPQEFLNRTVLTNLYDTPYQKVDFTCLPWSGFKNRSSMTANDYTPSTEVVRNGDYDHAFFRNEHKADNFFCITMPFAVSNYYFGADAEVYEYSAWGFEKDVDDEAMTLTTKEKEDLDRGQYFFTNQRYLIKSKHGDNLVKGTFNQFNTKQVNVNFQPAMYSDLGPTLFYVSGKDEVINPSMGNLYVLDNGYLKKVNGDYNLPAFSVAFMPDAEKKLHFIDSKTSEKLITDDKDVTTREDLMGYVSFYSEENSYAVDVEAEVYTVSQGADGLVFNLVKDNVVSQGQGVVIKYKRGETFNMQIVTNPSTDTEAYQANVLKGVEVDTPVSDLGNIYVLGKAELAVGFYPYSSSNVPGAGAMLPANRAYIDPMDVAPDALPYVIDYDVPTSINGINVDGKNSRIYDLSGRRVFNPEKGVIYIKDGQKYIQK
ncbi:leucine-rich repeat protein [Sodaliphilus sp.]|uniref:leucine-rich repeat domain-containing protein n=1 Tax=Sodaliphilus sp. TaxID=2815818 RepID=UPI00388F4A51